METLQLTLTEITSTKDPFFFDWLDLYETSFPPNEKMLVSDILKILDKNNANNVNDSTHLIALIDTNKNCIGMMLYYTQKTNKTAWLWYMAINPKVQSKGLGTYLYQELVKLLNTYKYKALFLEVEIPDEENFNQAKRRIHFYEKQGATLIKNIDYIQDIGWHTPPTPLSLMIQCFQPLDDIETFNLAKKMFGDAVTKQNNR